ncbi:MAG: hypothetical protein J6F30_10800 [Cellulosilyticum sp.]|nr:hypothetical protein [Cellulosilyticum sp.]
MTRLIITLTPFPSIEYIYSVEEFKPNELLTSKNVSLNILSKGIYSAQMMKVLQEEPILISSFGGFAGKSIKHYLDKSKIKSDIVWTDYETPHQVKIILEHKNEDYTLRSQESVMMDRELVRLNYKLHEHIKKVSTFVLSGKLLADKDSSIFKDWIQLAKHHNVKTIVSTGQKEVWSYIIEEKPYALFLTEEQLTALAFETDDLNQLTKVLTSYLGGGLHFICAYLKNRGALVLSKNKYCHVQSIYHLLNQNNTAASGAFLGALAISVNRQYEQEKMAKLCLAAALSADDNVAHRICNRKDIDYKYKKTKVSQIKL